MDRSSAQSPLYESPKGQYFEKVTTSAKAPNANLCAISEVEEEDSDDISDVESEDLFIPRPPIDISFNWTSPRMIPRLESISESDEEEETFGENDSIEMDSPRSIDSTDDEIDFGYDSDATVEYPSQSTPTPNEPRILVPETPEDSGRDDGLTAQQLEGLNVCMATISNYSGEAPPASSSSPPAPYSSDSTVFSSPPREKSAPLPLSDSESEMEYLHKNLSGNVKRLGNYRSRQDALRYEKILKRAIAELTVELSARPSFAAIMNLQPKFPAASSSTQEIAHPAPKEFKPVWVMDNEQFGHPDHLDFSSITTMPNNFYLIDNHSRCVRSFNSHTGKPVHTIEVPNGAKPVSLCADTETLFVLCQEPACVFTVDLSGKWNILNLTEPGRNVEPSIISTCKSFNIEDLESFSVYYHDNNTLVNYNSKTLKAINTLRFQDDTVRPQTIRVDEQGRHYVSYVGSNVINVYSSELDTIEKREFKSFYNSPEFCDHSISSFDIPRWGETFFICPGGLDYALMGMNGKALSPSDAVGKEEFYKCEFDFSGDIFLASLCGLKLYKYGRLSLAQKKW